MGTLRESLAEVNRRVRNAELKAGRKPGSVKLLAVSKTKPAADLALAYRCGQRHFAESYLQEAIDKQGLLVNYDITWHFIGPIQSNKTKSIAARFAWIHSVDRLKIAQRLNEQRPSHLPPLNVCLQVNISGETTKSGVSLEELPGLAIDVAILPRLDLRGVMAIPARSERYQEQRIPYRLLREAVEALNVLCFDTYSFGMSEDLEAAVAEGATMVRVGTAIFGSRTYKTNDAALISLGQRNR
ncbi:MAG: YggS family pyridoxal phosphate-dependent enzyme [Pseudomonadota bacterium]